MEGVAYTFENQNLTVLPSLSSFPIGHPAFAKVSWAWRLLIRRSCKDSAKWHGSSADGFTRRGPETLENNFQVRLVLDSPDQKHQLWTENLAALGALSISILSAVDVE